MYRNALIFALIILCSIGLSVGNSSAIRLFFMANVWFSTYKEGPTPKPAVIIAAVTEETAAAGANSGSMDGRERTPLTSREMEVLRLLVQGLPNKEIASRMKISESAVKNTLQQLFARTNVHTRSQLVRVALEQYRDRL